MKKLLVTALLLVTLACLLSAHPSNLQMEGNNVCFTEQAGSRICVSKKNITHTRSMSYTECEDCSAIYVDGLRYLVNIPHHKLRAFLR